MLRLCEINKLYYAKLLLGIFYESINFILPHLMPKQPLGPDEEENYDNHTANDLC